MHPEADALLNAIFDNPDDDTPRLVYADWLQEHDFEDYAQFIRLSIKADGGSKPPAERKRLRDLVRTDPSTQQSQSTSPASSLGGLLGRMKRRKDDQSGPARSTMLDSNHELLKASTTASADAVAIPAGFKLR